MPNLVRCSHCAEVVQADDTCSACGGPLRKTPVYRAEPSASYQERYSGTEFGAQPQVVKLPGAAPVRQSWSTLMIGLGIALVVVVGAVAGVMMLNGTGPAPTQQQGPVGHTIDSTVPPTLPAVASNAVRTISSSGFSAHLEITSKYRYNPSSGGITSRDVIVGLTISDGNVAGVYADTPFVVVGGAGYQQPKDSGTWYKGYDNTSIMALVPLLGVTDANQLQLIGEETLDGRQVYHLQNTNRWKPVTQRIAMLNFNPSAAAEKEALDFWVAEDGTPVKATYTGTAQGQNGSLLMSLETTYAFTNVGQHVSIEAPKDAKDPKK